LRGKGFLTLLLKFDWQFGILVNNVYVEKARNKARRRLDKAYNKVALFSEGLT